MICDNRQVNPFTCQQAKAKNHMYIHLAPEGLTHNHIFVWQQSDYYVK